MAEVCRMRISNKWMARGLIVSINHIWLFESLGSCLWSALEYGFAPWPFFIFAPRLTHRVFSIMPIVNQIGPWVINVIVIVQQMCMMCRKGYTAQEKRRGKGM